MMTSLKTWCLLPLAVLLLLSITPTVAEVVQLMSDCKGFLLHEETPEVPDILKDGEVMDHDRYKPICQTFNDKRRFLTLYDTKNKIPVFSAYKYRGSQGKAKKVWKIEPQLEDMNNDINMEKCKSVKYKQQASDADYLGNGDYDRGHLFPKSYGFEDSDKTSTFTLTNVVPQVRSFNQQSWSRMETCVKCIMDEYCIKNDDKEGFVVTGAKASEDKTMNNGVNVPSVLWSTFCCYSEKEKKWLASAHWGNNIPETDEYLQTKTLKELSQKLNIDVFHGTDCPQQETVAKYYPNNCECPPQTSTTNTAAHATTSQQQKYLELWSNDKKLNKICKNVLKERLKVKRKDVRTLCLKLKENKLSSKDIDLHLINLVHKILNNTDLFN